MVIVLSLPQGLFGGTRMARLLFIVTVFAGSSPSLARSLALSLHAHGSFFHFPSFLKRGSNVLFDTWHRQPSAHTYVLQHDFQKLSRGPEERGKEVESAGARPRRVHPFFPLPRRPCHVFSILVGEKIKFQS